MDYFLAKAGQKPLGPLSREQVRELLNERKYLITDLVWTAAQKDWLPISSRLEFYARPTPVSTSSIAPRLGYEPATVTRGPEKISASAMYESFIGPEKIAYYAPIFERLDVGKSPAIWNPAAAVITSWWMVYRGMFLWGLLWFPLLSLLMVMAALMVVTQMTVPENRPTAYVVSLGLLFLCSMALMGFYGTRLLHAHLRNKIEQSKALGLSPGQRLDWLKEKGRPRWAILALVIPATLGVLGLAGYSAGPAYQDSLVRAEVGEGLMRIEPLKKIYLERLTQSRKWPMKLQDLGVEGGFGAFGSNVASVRIGPRHELRVTFANSPIAGQSLSLVPDVQGNALVWTCTLDDLPKQYAPRSCR